MGGDALGSTRSITDSSQSVTDTKRFDAFGMLIASTGSNPTPFGFVGGSQYQTDADSGLMLLGHRYFDCSVGRFISRDPAYAGENWYAYCENNPLSNADPSGLDDTQDPNKGATSTSSGSTQTPPKTPPAAGGSSGGGGGGGWISIPISYSPKTGVSWGISIDPVKLIGQLKPRKSPITYLPGGGTYIPPGNTDISYPLPSKDTKPIMLPGGGMVIPNPPPGGKRPKDPGFSGPGKAINPNGSDKKPYPIPPGSHIIDLGNGIIGVFEPPAK